ncbi:MAG: hypothetical protein JOZ90_14085 [Alphaproteobacteria bacterium]|nr:hypothetical protein [Alphaproteobacteria bacterium]MBV9371592.1 hypothetical protein [Alphaproteobacteria bacterium]MBV9902201.1 hypothetical protein [Alphaproteobacteria bacterium]
MNRRFALMLPLAAAALAAGCNRGGDEGNNLASLDNQLVGNDADPALTSALADQIAVDPALANQSNRNAVRTPATPTQAQYPAPAPGQPAVRPAAADSDADGCTVDGPFDYGAGWAERLPAAFPVYPGGKVTEAAGYDRGRCRMRVVTFATDADWGRVTEWYRAQATRAGYGVRDQLRGEDHVLAGTAGEDGPSYYLIVTPKPRGSDVALIVDNGR